MSQVTVKKDELIAYINNVIRYAVYNHPDDVVYLLRNNGISVPDNVDKKTLHAMTLSAMINSDEFKHDLGQMLHAIAMEGQHVRYGSNFANQDGSVDVMATCDQSWFQQTFNPKTVDALITSGLALATAQLQKQGDQGIKDAVAAKPPAPPKKSNTMTILAVVLVSSVCIGGYLWWKAKHKK